jgi:hypothetical protein
MSLIDLGDAGVTDRQELRSRALATFDLTLRIKRECKKPGRRPREPGFSQRISADARQPVK